MDAKAAFEPKDFFWQPFSKDPALAATERELVMLRHEEQQANAQSAHEVQKLIADIGICDGTERWGFAVHWAHVKWLLQHHFNEQLGNYPIFEKLPFERSKNAKAEDKTLYLVGEINEEQKRGIIMFFNLLETGKLFSPVAAEDFTSLISGTCDKYQKLDRKAPLLKVWAINEEGAIEIKALLRTMKDYRRHARPAESIWAQYAGYQGIIKLCEIAKSSVLGDALPFLEKDQAWLPLDELAARYSNLSTLSKEKAYQWVFENVSEADFVALVDAVARNGNKAQLEKIDTILRKISWDRECIVRVAYNIDSHRATHSEYNKIISPLLRKKGLWKLLTKPEHFTLLFQDILPVALQTDTTAQSFGYSQNDLQYYADLRFEPTKQWQEECHTEYEELREKLKNNRTLSLAELRRLKKREMELEFIMLLMPFKNKQAMQEQTKSVIQENLFFEAVRTIGFDPNWRSSIAYSMVTGKSFPHFENPSSYSQCYFLDLMQDIVKLISKKKWK